MKNEDNKINFQIMETSSTLQTEELKDRTIESFKSRHEDLERFYIQYGFVGTVTAVSGTNIGKP